MDPDDTVRSYYDALCDGDPLGPYFAADEAVVKFGISEALRGHDAVGEALADQTATTTDWSVDSHGLLVEQRDDVAWFADEVSLAWTDTDRRIRYEFETRWSGTLVAESSSGYPWQFVTMHVSTAGDL
ncbi:nuclear transport factor 2 family protein [Halobacteriales archaeon Cl-PHB]